MTIKIAISQFKSHCLAIIEKLQTDKESIIITKRDREVAHILPINTKKISLFGMLKNKAEIKVGYIRTRRRKVECSTAFKCISSSIISNSF